MSDPVPNMEIEDVLSSIRRLVSTEDRFPKLPEEAAGQDRSEPVGKLVLTPALRVDDAPEDAGDDAQAASPDIPDTAEPEQTCETIDTETHAPDGAAEAVSDWSQPERFAGTQEEGVSDVCAPSDDDIAGEDMAEDTPVESLARSGLADLTARVAEFERAVAARDDQWEPDGDSAQDNAPEPADTLEWEDVTPEREELSRTGETTDEPFQEVAENEGLDPYVPEEDSAEEAGLYADAFDQDDRGQDAPGNAFAFDDDLLREDETILDEDMLRDLVAEIVRQELQGALGERITRNVRKLVRREIQRALTIQDFD